MYLSPMGQLIYVVEAANCGLKEMDLTGFKMAGYITVSQTLWEIRVQSISEKISKYRTVIAAEVLFWR